MSALKQSVGIKQHILPAVAGTLLMCTAFAAKAEHAVLSIAPETQCFDLMAGQSTDAGDVCLSVDGDNLVVDYQTEGGWMLGFINDFEGPEVSYTFFMPHTYGDAYLAVHLDAVGNCDANGNFCD